MKTIKLFSALAFISFLAFQSCQKIKEALVITVNVPFEKCHTIMAPVPAGEYSQEISINNTETQEVLTDNDVDISAIKSASPNEIVISIGNPNDTNFKITDVKSIKVEISTANKAAVKVVEQAIEDATVTENKVVFKADSSVDLTEYIKETNLTMKVSITTGANVNEDTELCFELKNNVKIGLPQ